MLYSRAQRWCPPGGPRPAAYGQPLRRHRRRLRSGGGRAVVSQVDGGRWLSLEGTVTGVSDPTRVAAAVAGYTARYKQPKEREDRVAIEIAVDRVLGRA